MKEFARRLKLADNDPERIDVEFLNQCLKEDNEYILGHATDWDVYD